MTIKLNGDTKEVAARTVADLLEELSAPQIGANSSQRYSIARDRCVVPISVLGIATDLPSRRRVLSLLECLVVL